MKNLQEKPVFEDFINLREMTDAERRIFEEKDRDFWEKMVFFKSRGGNTYGLRCLRQVINTLTVIDKHHDLIEEAKQALVEKVQELKECYEDSGCFFDYEEFAPKPEFEEVTVGYENLQNIEDFIAICGTVDDDEFADCSKTYTKWGLKDIYDTICRMIREIYEMPKEESDKLIGRILQLEYLRGAAEGLALGRKVELYIDYEYWWENGENWGY